MADDLNGEGSEQPHLSFVDRFERAGGLLTAGIAAHGTAMAATLGFWAYFATWLSNRVFLSPFGVSPQEAGLGYEQLLPVGATVLLVAVAIVTALVVAVASVAASSAWHMRPKFRQRVEADGLAAAGTWTNWLVHGAFLTLSAGILAAVFQHPSFLILLTLPLFLVGHSLLSEVAAPPPEPKGAARLVLRAARERATSSLRSGWQRVAPTVRRCTPMGMVVAILTGATAFLLWAIPSAADAATDFRECRRAPTGIMAFLIEEPTPVRVLGEDLDEPDRVMWLLATHGGAYVLYDRDAEVVHRLAVDRTTLRTAVRAPGSRTTSSRPDGCIKRDN